MRWYGHMTRSTGLAKMILQGKVQEGGGGGGRRKGRAGTIIYQNRQD